MKMVSTQTVQRAAPFVGRGLVIFVNVRPEATKPSQAKWICDECFTRVIPSKMTDHASRCRG